MYSTTSFMFGYPLLREQLSTHRELGNSPKLDELEQKY